jgi:hypothetical protein
LYTEFSKDENELNTAGFLKKRKIQAQYEKTAEEIEREYMIAVRDFADILRKEHKDACPILQRLQSHKQKEVKSILAISFPSVGAGDQKDAAELYQFTKSFSDQYLSIRQLMAREVKAKLDENKRIVETYEKHVTIDRVEISATVSNDDVSDLSLGELIDLHEKLVDESKYLEGRKDEVSRMIGSSLVAQVEALQASVETASRFGLELPMDFGKQLRLIARDASKATKLTDLLTLENKLDTQQTKLASLLRDKILNMKHETTSKIAAGGIPTTAEVIPEAPMGTVETDDVTTLMSTYQRMVEWVGQVKVSLKDEIEELLEEVQSATEAPDDTGIKDIMEVRKFLADSKKTLEKAEIDEMIKIYLKAKSMEEQYKKYVTDIIRDYISRFNELATSADRVLDYAQLSKKAPKVEEISSGGIMYLLKSLADLRSAVESGVETFRTASQTEIDAIIGDLQTIKPAYAEIFMPIIIELEEGANRIAGLSEFAEIRSEMRSIKDGILVKAKESLENLRYRLGVKIRLAAAKLMGAGVQIPKETQEAISELNNIGVAAEQVFELPKVARKMIELYEKKITATIIDSLIEEVNQLVSSFERAQTIGLDLKKELKTLMTLQESPPEELEDAADAFDKLTSLTTSTKVHKRIKDRADTAYVQIKDALQIFEDQDMSQFVERLKVLLDKVPSQLEDTTTNVNEALDVCLTLASIQDEMLGVIKEIARKDSEAHAKEVEKRSKYYSTIERVFEKHPDDFSRLIYPLKKMRALEKELTEATMLDTAISSFNELKELRTGWIEKIEKMDDWHKTLRMFITGFSPSEPPEERDKFLDDAVKKIRETFSKEDISSYLTWAIREIAQAMVEKRG